MRSSRPLFVLVSTMIFIPSVVSALALAPSSQELTAKRGETITSSITVINALETEQEYYVGLLGFRPKDDSGAPEFYEPDPTQSDLTDWILFEQDRFIVPALSFAEIPFRVVVPDDISAQGYYAAITLSPAPADVVATNGAIIEAKTAALVLLTVEGETQERLELLDFTRTGDSYQYRIQNQGNVHATPIGTIRITSLFGQVISEVDANPESGRVLPGSTRTFEVPSEEPTRDVFDVVAYQLSHWAMGPATTTLSLTYGDQGSIESTLTFWLFPWELIITILGLAVILRFGYRLWPRRH